MIMVYDGDMSTSEAAARIGQRAYLSIENGKLKVEVEVLDHKSAYGEDRWLVRPSIGCGSIWVSDNRVSDWGGDPK